MTKIVGDGTLIAVEDGMVQRRVRQLRALTVGVSTIGSLLVGCSLLLGCASGSVQPRSPQSGPPPAMVGTEHGGKDAARGTSVKNPVVRCGPDESYEYVADEFRCPSGENPFRGSVEAARQARRGSDENPENGHVIDIYRVPCESGNVHLFVDLYGCDTYQKRLVSDEKQSRELDVLMARYEALDFQGVAEHCARTNEAMPADEASECMTLLPASLVMLGRPDVGIGLLGELCANMPQASSLSDIRTHVVIRTMAFVDHARERAGAPLGDEEGSRLLGAFASVCSVSGGDIERYVQKHEML